MLFHSIENPLVHQIPSLVAISKPRDREKDGSVRGQRWLDIGWEEERSWWMGEQ